MKNEVVANKSQYLIPRCHVTHPSPSGLETNSIRKTTKTEWNLQRSTYVFKKRYAFCSVKKYSTISHGDAATNALKR